MNEILYTYNSVLMSESLGNLREKFLKWNEVFDSKKLRTNLKKTEVMVSGLKEDILKSKVN